LSCEIDTEDQIITFKSRGNHQYHPLCTNCYDKEKSIHSTTIRKIRDLNIGNNKVYIENSFRNLRCSTCGIKIEDLEFVSSGQHVTKRLEHYIVYLCSIMTIKDVSNHLDLDWRLVKRIDKKYLGEAYSHVHQEDLRILAFDEISIKKGHKYLTVALNYETGKVIWMGEGRSKETMDEFFGSLSEHVRNGISAVVMDMWEPYFNSTKRYCPNAKIVYDFFHIVSAFGKVIDKVRNQEYHKATDENKNVIKGSRYLLLKNTGNLTDKEKPKLENLLNVNSKLSEVYILKDYLKEIWKTDDKNEAELLLKTWCQAARETQLQPVIKFAKMLETHKEGILNHCDYPIHTGVLEGINNKIKVIKRKAYGYVDTQYFIIKVKSIFGKELPNWCN